MSKPNKTSKLLLYPICILLTSLSNPWFLRTIFLMRTFATSFRILLLGIKLEIQGFFTRLPVRHLSFSNLITSVYVAFSILPFSMGEPWIEFFIWLLRAVRLTEKLSCCRQ
uniref:Uncharacterized protein n=1 Tax=Arundo donax TaxID=35708 RepID=A0A0A9GRL8_ARUDO